jgi:biotin operon repressor
VDKIKTIISQKPDELKVLESQQRVTRHDQIQDPKPCFSAYIDGLVLPVIGERNSIFHALSAEYRRMGYSEDMAYTRMTEYYFKLPDSITSPPGQPFTLKEVEIIVRAVYRSRDNKSRGCNSGFWDKACIKESCSFKKKISGKSGQSFEAAYFYFTSHWLNSNLYDSDIKTYLSLMVVERRREFKPGSTIFVSHRELSDICGVFRNRVNDSLERLQKSGLILYVKGKQHGIASEITRIIPIPKYIPCSTMLQKEINSS